MSSQAVVAPRRQRVADYVEISRLRRRIKVSFFLYSSLFPCPVASVSLSSAAQQPKTVEDQRGRTEPEGSKH